MQPKVVGFFSREFNRHKEFSIISEVFFSVSPFSRGITCQGAYVHLGISLRGGGEGQMSFHAKFYRGAKYPRGLMSYTRFATQACVFNKGCVLAIK